MADVRRGGIAKGCRIPGGGVKKYPIFHSRDSQPQKGGKRELLARKKRRRLGTHERESLNPIHQNNVTISHSARGRLMPGRINRERDRG